MTYWAEVAANSLTEPTDQYLRTFSWNKVRYRADRPLGELIENLQKVLQLFYPVSKPYNLLTTRLRSSSM